MSRGRIMAYLAEVDLTAADGTSPTTLYLSDLPMRPWPSTDANRPNQSYDSRILEAPSIGLEVFADASRLTGALGTGALVLSNADGALNQYRGSIFTAVRVWWGEIKTDEEEERSFAADFRKIVDARPEAPAWDVTGSRPSRLEIPIYDRRADLENDIQEETFDGSNSGATGYEGTADDLKDSVKPLALGDLVTANIPLIWVNATAQVAQAHAGEMEEYSAIYDRGAATGLTDDGDVSGSAFDSASPSAGHRVTDLGRGLLKVNQSFGGVVTAGVKGAVDLVAGVGYLDTAPELIAALIERQDPAATIGPTFAAISETAKVGLYIAERTSTARVIEALARSIACWVLPDPLGVWQIGKLHLPTGSPDRTIDDVDIISIRPGDPEVSRPVWSVTVRGGRLYQTHSRSNLAGSIWGTDAEERLRREWRTGIKKDTALRDLWWPNVRSIDLETALRDPADLTDVAELLFDCMSVREDGTPFAEWVVTVEQDEEWLDLLADPGIGKAEVRLRYSADDIDRVMIVMAAQPGRPTGGQLTLRLWG
ncbi:hypothetical protein T8K17_01765 [Thalassobaculum sp. OXR-137]|uniref:hypothetical protein n=1 Tax=Thalassobaculum sp. OXR-137 TaxID=3100173 RepID=UPI002AC8E338|nr:hypothetical protein [Thalassobaculum sp. OXR-137]WPZ33230.1 hypothetical protein T8K17_18550 [Thalassobaculum sp. OXR-137]WPZ34877.1 hypothetical protein T8K17_01765 [Thalassobaculum sp. OXR-137]